MGAKLLQDVRQDLADVVHVCEGKKKQTNYLRTLINELVKGVLGSWAPAGPTRSCILSSGPASPAAGPPHSGSLRKKGQGHLFSFYAGPSNMN